MERGKFLCVSQAQIVKFFEDRGFDCDQMGGNLPRAGYYLRANEGDKVEDLFRTSAGSTVCYSAAPERDWLGVNVFGPYDLTGLPDSQVDALATALERGEVEA